MTNSVNRGAWIAGAALALAPALAGAQTVVEARPEDVISPEAIVAAAYASIVRAPGEPFQWDRMRSLFLPGALMIPNTEQTGGEFRPMTVEEFIAWIDGWYTQNAPIGGPQDQGFVEEQIWSRVERYGDVAHVLSTYQKRLHGAEEILGRGINSFQLVHAGGRWHIVSIAWDEESGAGEIPAEYLP